MVEAERKIDLLDNWLLRRWIKVILFDLDGTILDTGKLFRTQVAAYAEYVENRLPALKNGHSLLENIKKLLSVSTDVKRYFRNLLFS